MNDRDVMKIADFIEDCKDGSFIDYDGFGYYSNGNEKSDKIVKPSDILAGNIDKNYTHVVWYNR